MSEASQNNNQRKDRSWMLLFLLLLLLCMCLSTPTIAKQSWGKKLKPVGDFVEQIVCKVPQLTTVQLVCPSAGQAAQEQACGTPCIAGDPNACPSNLSCKFFAQDSGNSVGSSYCWNDAICGGAPPPGIGNGQCGDHCDPQNPNCVTGTNCVADPGSDYYVCWGQNVCLGGGTSPHGCNARCGGSYGDCADGLTCASTSSSAPKCWNTAICMPASISNCNNNGTCDAGETCTNCKLDCGACPTCGNSQCEPGEDCTTCPADCGNCSNCGNSHCSEDENCSTCPQDCGPCCSCGDGACNCSENETTCPADCKPTRTCTCDCTNPCGPTASCLRCVDSCTGGTCKP
jgi:hypothetical protein